MSLTIFIIAFFSRFHSVSQYPVSMYRIQSDNNRFCFSSILCRYRGTYDKSDFFVLSFYCVWCLCYFSAWLPIQKYLNLKHQHFIHEINFIGEFESEIRANIWHVHNQWIYYFIIIIIQWCEISSDGNNQYS